MKLFFLTGFISFFIFLSCNSPKKEVVLVLDKDLDKNVEYPYKPEKINISYVQDSIFIKKEFSFDRAITYSLYLKNKEFYFFNKKKVLGKYSFFKPYLFFKKQGPDSCYSISFPKKNNSIIPNVKGLDLCFSRIKGGNFTTVIHFVSLDTISYSENFFYTPDYRIYKIAIRYDNKLYWYRVKK